MQGEQPIDRQFGDLSVTQLIVMAGLPGAGKSTIGEIVGARLGATVVSVDPIESAILRAGIDADQPTGLAAVPLRLRRGKQQEHLRGDEREGRVDVRPERFDAVDRDPRKGRRRARPRGVALEALLDGAPRGLLEVRQAALALLEPRAVQ